MRIDSILSDPLLTTHPGYTRSSSGAILSKLLFCDYMNDLPGAPQFCQLESYIDDSKVLLSFPVTDFNASKIKLEEDLRKVAIWCCENQLPHQP